MLDFLNTLTWWQWLVLAAVPPAIVALYFLKLKRRPLEVPSTFLWHKSIEDLHVNTIWQRLRRNLLLFLQLLLIFLVMVALLRPGWRGAKLTGNRFIFLVDNSASMQATDLDNSRLDEAKRLVSEMIEQMKSGDAGMIVSFADAARIEQMFTDNRRQLRRSLEAIQPTKQRTSLAEALKVASGLANPGRSAYDMTDVQVAEPMPATMVILSDGKFPQATDFDPGNLDPVYVPVGADKASNVGIVIFTVRRHETRPGELQAYARLENFGPEEVKVSVELRLDGQLNNADSFRIAPGEPHAVVFPLGEVASGVLHLVATTGDDLTVDDEAWAVVNQPREATVLLVTAGNEPLEYALGTGLAARYADLSVAVPDFLDKEEYRQKAKVGAYDLVIYDRCAPKEMPQANTLFIGALPPVEGWKAEPKVVGPRIIDVDPAHPLMQWVSLGDVIIADGTPLETPPGGTVLVDTHLGPMLAIAPREGFEDAVLGFVLLDEVSGSGTSTEMVIGTNWMIRPSFPVFVLNVLEYLGGGRANLGREGLQPGVPMALESPDPTKPLEVRTPTGRRIRLKPATGGKFSFSDTQEPGVYEVRYQGKVLERFAVNLFDAAESDIVPRREIQLPVTVKGQASGWESARRETWKLLLLLALGVLCFEWYVYNRRVYM